MTKVLACIDASIYGLSVCDHAAWAARLLKADVELLHVLDRAPDAVAADMSGSIGLGAREHLLENLTRLDEERGRLRMERGRALLEGAEARLRDQGLTVVTRLRHGSLVDNVTELEPEARVVVLGKRGEAADFARLHLGGSVEQVVRSTTRPVLVASRAFKPVQRILLAYDGGASSRKAIAFLVSDAAFKDFDVHVVMAGTARAENEAHMAWADSQLKAWGGAYTMELRAGDPESVIADYVKKAEIDLLTMGAYGHSPIRRFIVGSTTTAMIRTCLIPVLLFR
ncbi:universal stress protein [Brevundimonas sp. BAL450]|jgi:nucleotide-binding universal stress UspA family protein|uniref:Universal stress protein family 4 n=1 Tax=Brevundimonas abyssalis TAR-001 TaxID=1391729 RepID=A0A8E0NDJ9_9CAUL|nr:MULTISPECIES: universal stress protein [Brevundimonas]MBG7616444.1 universal stress protein [Brevundimonas sp. BAL450]GAD60404.1 universal stress protein family 4 [Brevundimonas abyssalis TAR-001]